VRAANATAEAEALAKRYEEAHNHAVSRGVVQEFDKFVEALQSSSHVVVAMQPLQARQFLSDPRQLYVNYETLVGTPIRTPAPFDDDSERRTVSGRLFGSYADKITYGVLSLDHRGLPNYGIVFLCLRDIAVIERVSFLHENSYFFLRAFAANSRDQIPPGYRSDWQHRSELAAAKLEPEFSSRSTTDEWAKLLVMSGSNRSDDSFIEAHIYGPFNQASVDSVLFTNNGGSRDDKRDIKCIKELMSARCLIGSKS
jgi:hypothetical protein